MRGGFTGATTAALAAFLLIAPGAKGSTEVGSQCVANSSLISGFEGTLFPLTTRGPERIPTSAPTAGIATQWIARVGPKADTFRERLKVLRPTSNPKEMRVIAESPLESVSSGHEAFAIRIPVQAGDRFGLSGPTGSLACTPAGSGEMAGVTVANGLLDSTQVFYEITSSQAAVSVMIEPDADNDGFGDDTQDGCPRFPSIQSDCPVLSFGVNARGRKKSIVVWVNASSAASIEVVGQVSWVRPKKKANANLPQRKRRLIVYLPGGRQDVQGGYPTRFRIPLPESVLQRLGTLAAEKYLKVTLTVRASDSLGQVANRDLLVKLPGQVQ